MVEITQPHAVYPLYCIHIVLYKTRGAADCYLWDPLLSLLIGSINLQLPHGLQLTLVISLQ